MAYQIITNTRAAIILVRSFMVAPFYSDGQFSRTHPSAQPFFLGHNVQLFTRSAGLRKTAVSAAQQALSLTSANPWESGQATTFLYRKRLYTSKVNKSEERRVGKE